MSQHTLGPGDLVDRRYRLEAPIADGGMSTVYLATDTRLDRHVALKLLSPTLAGDNSFVSRLELEAKSVARLSHPGVVQVFDHGFDDGHAFLVMELVPGGTLREILDERGPMPAHVVMSVLRPILGALSEAHSNGLIHRDIKPENILVSTNNSVKLADFGLVRAVAESRSTSQNVVMGTAAYLAPEQIATGDTDPRSDLYSLGIVAFELLTGQVPFQGDTPVATAYQRLERPVPPPSSIVSGIPEDLDDLIVHATERNLDARISSAREFLRRVEDVSARNRLFHVPVPAPSSSAWSRARERAAREAAEGTGAGAPKSETVFDIASRETGGGPAALGAGAAAGAAAGVAAGAGAAETNIIDGHSAIDGPTRVHSQFPGSQAGDASPETPTRVHQRHGQPPEYRERAAATAVYPGAPVQGPGGPGAGVPPRGQQPPVPAPNSRPLPEVPENLQKKRGAGCLWAVAVLVLVAILGVAGWWLGSGRLIEVPDVSGMSVSEASAAIAGVGLVSTEETQYDNDAPQGDLLGTDPTAGNRVEPGGTVTVLVSAGQPSVPEISADRSRSAVEAALNERSLVPVVAENAQYSNDVPEGAVVELSPAPGTLLHVGDEVELVLSGGPPPVDVPKLEGLRLADAQAALESVGLRVGNVREVFDRSAPGGTVISSDPNPGESLRSNSPVSLTVSTASKVPDVRGMDIDQARAELEAAGFTVVDGPAVTDEDVLSGKAAKTEPAADEVVDTKNTTIRLVPSNSVRVPLVLGDTVSSASDKLREMGLRPKVSSGDNGVVYGQNPLPGRVVGPNTEVRLSALG